MSTETVERQPAYRVRKNEEGLTERAVEIRDLLHQNLTQNEIAERLGIHRSRVSEIKRELIAKGKLNPPKAKEPLSRAEWDATRKALLALTKSAGAGTSVGRAAARALDKVRDGLLPEGAAW